MKNYRNQFIGVFLLIAIIVGLLSSCAEEKIDPVLPTLTTETVTDIETSVAISGGTIVSDGGSAITSKGIVYSKTPSPTTGDSKTSETTTSMSFTSVLSGLTSNTKYYVRAYAINSVGTSYGNEVSFTTKKKPAHFITTSVVTSTTTFGSYALDVTVKNDGESTGYNVGAVINALQGTTIIDTATAFPANLGDILPGQSAMDQAIFFNLTPEQAASLTFSAPVITWISKD